MHRQDREQVADAVARSRQKKAAVLRDAARSGRPSTVPRWVRLELIKLACDRPVKHKQRFRDVWTLATFAYRAGA
jgi:hypothetical protein